ncbi:MAG: hypothetical protein ACEY3D_09695 [Rickettsia sp.]|uniref:hypothetical protein n=1 Tax=Rickettsia sp. TaxID=789 RepID=UPI00397C6766
MKKKESEQIHKTVFQGLSYIVIRFQKINFDITLPFIKKFIKLDKSCVHIYTGSFLVNIAIMIPELRKKVMPFLKKAKSPYLKEIQALNH